MSLPQYFTLFCLSLAAFSDVGSAHQAASIGKRSLLLEGRQECATPGWVPICPVGIPCVPPGGICCSDGFTYVLPPDTCPDGTEPLATASTGTPPSTITSAAVSPTAVVSYTFFTTEFTWYYWYYYLTYIAIYSSTATTSSQVTTVTTVSVSATNSAAAIAQFNSLSATLSFPTPTQASTPLSSPGPYLTSTTHAATATASSAPTTIALSPSTTPTFTGAASPLSAGVVARVGGTWAMVVLVLVPALIMVWI